jgi:FkbM family methyltransferase
VYAGGTVTFTCIQLAYYFGFREIYLIGVDADYKIPADAEVVGRTGVSELDMKSDDPNHFDPNYFGKGFRWHDPNVDRMLAAYAEAKRVTEASGASRIYNATVGGKLEVFPRVSYDELFSAAGHLDTPRTLLIDMSPFGEATATGELKRSYFERFPPDDLLHLSAGKRDQLRLAPGVDSKGPDARVFAAGDRSLDRACRAFDPDVILYRPVSDRPDLHEAAMRLIRTLGKPWVIWLMDDWPERLRVEKSRQFLDVDQDLRELLRGASDRFAISEAMAEAFELRYGVTFQIFRNGISPAQWQSLRHVPAPDGTVRIRYAGSLAPDTTRDSVYEVARVVEEMAARHRVRLEIRTHATWYKEEKERYAGFEHVSFDMSDLDSVGYRQWLTDADLVLIAYNFDPKTLRYLTYSFANKTPEYLASGAAVLAYGPREIATIRFLGDCDVASIVDVPDSGRLAAAIEELVADKAKRLRLGEAGRRLAGQRLNLEEQQARFVAALNAVARRSSGFDLPQVSAFESVRCSRDEKAQVDECRLAFELLKSTVGGGGVMIDVGAHHGSSLSRFAELGWIVYAFEPDPTNRARLRHSHGKRPNVVISEEAVCDVAGQTVPFYASDESTGISSLGAFRDSHREVARVRTTTLNDVITAHGLKNIDFLKIDVEGFEMAVLRGLDFDRMKPSVVVAEFEDQKTKSLGYMSHDLARLLADRGYTVYISEWHPVERYGVKHSWHGIRRYPCDIPSDAWGNLIAFQQDPPVSQLMGAVRAAADRPVRFVGYPDVTDSVTAGVGGKSSRTSRANPRGRSGPMFHQMSRLVRGPVGLSAAAFIVMLLIVAAATSALPASWMGAVSPSLLFYVVAINLLFLAIASGALFGYARARSRRVRRSVLSRLDELAEQLKRRAEMQERTARLIVEQLNQRAEAQERMAKLVSANTLALSRLNAANASRARQHARLLDDAALARLEKHWAPLFGLHLRPSALAYLAHQICIAEDRCDGRLATAIETAMLRQLALRSLPGPEIDLLEIGTLFGIGGGLLYRLRGDRITRLRLTLVDPLNGYYAAGEPDPVTGVMVGVDTVKRNLRALDVPEENVILLQGLSTDEDIVAAAKQRRYDFALIDGDHSGEGVRRDFELYGPLIRPGGLVLFDDYDTKEWPEIKPAVDDLMKAAEGWEWVGAEWRTGIARRLPSGGR